MFLLVGLGNPGLGYACTRHNVGFMFAEYISHSLGFSAFASKFDSLYCSKIFDSRFKVFIQKPQTFMNLSGKAVSQLASFFQISTQNIFVIHDDIDLESLDVKIKFSGSSGGHNGIRSIDSVIGKEYWRIKVGVGRPISKDGVADYVLSPFYADELVQIQQRVFVAISNFILDLMFLEDKMSVISKIKNGIKSN
jgi:PTH1 family peptidyl-tRNA hydrolase